MDSGKKREKDYDILAKMVIIGDSGVGKSALMLRKCDNTFSDVCISTIGVDFRYITVNIDDQIIKLQIWDTAGQERFRTITYAYYRSADGVLVVYDVSNRTTFEHVMKWVAECRTKGKNGIKLVLVGNKCDSASRVVSYEEGKKYADELGIPFIECSAKTGKGITETFNLIAKEMAGITRTTDKDVIIIVPPPIHPKESCC